eukprot:TRINITY_DN55130_c0_g1_i1.p1 TRINITY_DN55130_c0_g1~~TRINITY_DN55130_c0_g1_i1.p1  ORF type:complete len:747 (+),score=83.40 TRINITY_DN55130_c0_g1_i1:232-2241(+)
MAVDRNLKDAAVRIMEAASTRGGTAINAAKMMRSRSVTTPFRRAHSDGSKHREGVCRKMTEGPAGDARTSPETVGNVRTTFGRRENLATATDRACSAVAATRQRSVSPSTPQNGIVKASGGRTALKDDGARNVSVGSGQGSRPRLVSPSQRQLVHAGAGGKSGTPLRPPLPSIGSPEHAKDVKHEAGLAPVVCAGKAVSQISRNQSQSPRPRGSAAACGKRVSPASTPPSRIDGAGEEDIEGAVRSTPTARRVPSPLTSPRANKRITPLQSAPSTPLSTNRHLSPQSPWHTNKGGLLGAHQQVASPVTTPRSATRPLPLPRTASQGLLPQSQQDASSLAAVAVASLGAAACHVSPQRVKLTHLEWLEEVLRPRPRVGLGDGASARLDSMQKCCEDEETAAVLFDEITFGEALGAGSFGAVWKGMCRGQVVAIKQCKVGDRKEANMLLEEIGHLQKLRHPRLVSFLGHCDRDPHIVLLIEYMPGGSLHALLFGSRRQRLAFCEEIRMAKHIAEGLTYLHDLNVVHRDLKTMNIVLDLELNCKICDFGLTVTLERTHLTVLSVQGSPRYMAPEQFEASAKITEKVDVWQFGCVMFELFCLALPFSHCSSLQQIATTLLIRKQGPAIPSEANPLARTLIRACLRLKAPSRPTAAALEEALNGIAQKRLEAIK